MQSVRIGSKIPLMMSHAVVRDQKLFSRILGNCVNAVSAHYYFWEKYSYLIILVSYVMFKTDVTQIGISIFHLTLPLSMLAVVAFNEYYAEKVSLTLIQEFKKFLTCPVECRNWISRL